LTSSLAQSVWVALAASLLTLLGGGAPTWAGSPRGAQATSQVEAWALPTSGGGPGVGDEGPEEPGMRGCRTPMLQSKTGVSPLLSTREGPGVLVGLYYYRLRYYDPEAGRFVSRDPLGMWGDPRQRGNAQSYAGCNPINRVDPLGLDDGPVPQPPPVPGKSRKRSPEEGYLIDWTEGYTEDGQVTGKGRNARTTLTGFNPKRKTPLDLQKVEKWLRVAIKRLEHFVTGESQLAEDRGVKLKPKSTDACVREQILTVPDEEISDSMTRAEVLEAARKTLAAIKRMMWHNEKIEIFTEKFDKDLEARAYFENLTGRIYADLNRAVDERTLARSVIHELLHKYGDVPGGGLGYTPGGSEAVGGSRRTTKRDNANFIVDQFFSQGNWGNLKVP